jgi:hypothetical protein
MDAIVKNVRDIDSAERRMLERVLGRPLGENQQVVVQIVDAPVPQPDTSMSSGPLPSWCNVFSGLSEEEMTAVEAVLAQRPDFSRSIE